MRPSRTTTIIIVVALVYLSMWFFRDGGRNLLGSELFSSEAILGKVGDLPYVTFFSYKNPERPSSPEGWWSIVLEDGNKPVVVPGRIMSSPGKLLFVERWQMVRIGVEAQNWYFSGLLEGFVLSSEIKETLEMARLYYGRISASWQGIMGQKLAKFDELLKFHAGQVQHAQSLKPSAHLNITSVLNHMQGMVDGYNMRFAPKIEAKKQNALTLADLFLINSLAEIVDVGAYAKNEVLNFGVNPSTEYGKRHGKKIFLLSALLVSGRTSSSLIEMKHHAKSVDYPNINLSWANQLWQAKSMKRIFARLSIAGMPSQGYQFIGFPGQIISMDSFTMTIGSSNRFASMSMRQLDFRESSFKSIHMPPLSSWMLISAAYHAPNVTLDQFIDIWNHSRPYLASQDWKTVCISKSQVNVLQSLSDGLSIHPTTATFLQDKYLLEEPSMTYATGQSLKNSNWDYVGHSPSSNHALQDSDVDTIDHFALWNAMKQDHEANTQTLPRYTRKDVEAARDEVSDSFYIYLDSNVEYVELSDLN